MPGVVGLIGVLWLNWRRHRRGKPTICATFRRYVPRWAVIPFWSAVTAFMVPHLRNGYLKRILEETL